MSVGVRGLAKFFPQTCFIGCFTQCVFAGGGRPKNAARISFVSRSWAGVIWAAFFRCSVEHYNRMCTRITCITHKGHVWTLNESLTQSNSRLLADHVIV